MILYRAKAGGDPYTESMTLCKPLNIFYLLSETNVPKDYKYYKIAGLLLLLNQYLLNLGKLQCLINLSEPVAEQRVSKARCVLIASS